MNQVTYNKSEETTTLINDDKNDVIIDDIKLPVPVGTHGLNVVTTCVFIVGVIAGAGFLSLPKAIDDTGWIGFVIIVACCGVSSYTGHLLGKCWLIVQEDNPLLREVKIGDPYPTIGEMAYGKMGRAVVSFSIFFTMFGTAVVYILLAAENIRDLLPRDNPMNVCYLSLVIGGVITPLTWLGSPKDSWGVAAAATLATGTASVILFIAVLDTNTTSDDVTHTNVSVVSFFTGYGIICSAFCGHPAFPTFQTDMKDPSKFDRAIILGYFIVLLVYIPSCIVGYLILGANVQPNIIGSLSAGPTKTIVSVLMTTHLLFGIIIVLNPVSQGIEHALKIPNNFTWKRVVSRTCIMAAALFVLESVPHFSSILALVGGSTISILSFICPPLFYMKLAGKANEGGRSGVPLHMKIFYVEIMLIGTVAGCAATYSAITDLATNKFTVPCYIDPVKASQ